MGKIIKSVEARDDCGYRVNFADGNSLSFTFHSDHMSCDSIRNDILFEYAHISDDEKYSFQKKILGYTYEDGLFPVCDSKEDIRKLFLAVCDLLTDKTQVPLEKDDFKIKINKIKVKLNTNL